MKKSTLSDDLDQVEKLAFKRLNILKNCLGRVHALLDDEKYVAFHEQIDLLRRWLIIAVSLHGSDFKGVTDYIHAQITAGLPIDESIIQGLKHYAEIPPEAVQKAVMEGELLMQKGKYEHFLSDQAKDKSRAAEERLANDPEVKAAWESFSSRHTKWCRQRKVARRSLMRERNMEQPKFEPTPECFRQFELDAISYRWTLWGFEDGEALLQKLTVAFTAHGINIFIPRWWSFDYRRDLNWPAILEVLRLWGVGKQGEKRSFGEMEVGERNKLMYVLHEQGKADGKKGDDLQRHVEKEVGLPPMDDGNYRRCLRRGKRAIEGKKKKD